MVDLINWKPENLPPEAMPWARQIEDQIQSLAGQASRADESSGNANASVASTMAQLSQQIAAIAAASAAATAASNAATAASNAATNAVAQLTAQQNYLNSLQPVQTATSSSYTNVAANTWGSIRPSVSLNTAAGGRVKITYSCVQVSTGGSLPGLGVYSVSGATTISRESRVAGNEALNVLLVNGSAEMSWIVSVAPNANITVTGEFYASGAAAVYGYPKITAQNVA